MKKKITKNNFPVLTGVQITDPGNLSWVTWVSVPEMASRHVFRFRAITEKSFGGFYDSTKTGPTILLLVLLLRDFSRVLYQMHFIMPSGALPYCHMTCFSRIT